MSTRPFIVLYDLPGALMVDPPQVFRCEAEGEGRARAQCIEQHPSATVVWVHAGTDAADAMSLYYNLGM